MNFPAKRLVAIAGLVALLCGCATQAPKAGTATPTPTLSAPASTQTLTPEPSSTPSASPSMSVSAAPKTVFLLGGKGIGKFKFGAKENDVLSFMESQFGEPSDIFEDPYCYFNEKSPYSKSVTWDDFTVVFLAKNTKKTSARTLQAWSYTLKSKLASAYALEDGVDPSHTFSQLKKEFPKAKSSKIGMDETLLTLPNNIRLIGEGTPALIAAGYDDPECNE